MNEWGNKEVNKRVTERTHARKNAHGRTNYEQRTSERANERTHARKRHERTNGRIDETNERTHARKNELKERTQFQRSSETFTKLLSNHYFKYIFRDNLWRCKTFKPQHFGSIPLTQHQVPTDDQCQGQSTRPSHEYVTWQQSSVCDCYFLKREHSLA